jgi:hypothetical protein
MATLSFVMVGLGPTTQRATSAGRLLLAELFCPLQPYGVRGGLGPRAKPGQARDDTKSKP